jgi:uncharacterized protein
VERVDLNALGSGDATSSSRFIRDREVAAPSLTESTNALGTTHSTIGITELEVTICDLKSSIMRIAVLADTHDRYPPALPERLRGADEIWHLGDVCAPETLAEFAALGPPLHVVQGNCDDPLPWPPDLALEREGLRFYLTHIPPGSAPAGCDVVLHGHTHLPRDEMIDGVRWLNPGSITRPRTGPPSFAWLEVEKGKLRRWSIVPL